MEPYQPVITHNIPQPFCISCRKPLKQPFLLTTFKICFVENLLQDKNTKKTHKLDQPDAKEIAALFVSCNHVSASSDSQCEIHLVVLPASQRMPPAHLLAGFHTPRCKGNRPMDVAPFCLKSKSPSRPDTKSCF